jgi:hypothetical protein
MLYTDVKKASTVFASSGSRPTRFLLKSKPITTATSEIKHPVPPLIVAQKEAHFNERDLHPLMVVFANDRFSAYCKTIFHEKSQKKGDKQNQWIHPDIVGFSLPSLAWKGEVVSLYKSTVFSARLYSFELKISLSFTSLREYFFQAVSNSSWAHEGYLVVSEIDEDPDLMEELRRLSQSFGIGVIRLDRSNPHDSEVILAAKERDEIDWETTNRIASINPDFRAYLSSVSASMQVNQAVVHGFDLILDDPALVDYLSSKFQKA